MSQKRSSQWTAGAAGRGRTDELRASPMMAHLLGALEADKDIGHYGRLVFAIVARHFLPDDELVAWLIGQPGMDVDEARALLRQVEERGYSPPRREHILQWQAQQDFPICPKADDPDACNIYRELSFPDDVYEHIEEYHEQKAQAEDASE